MNLDTYVDLIDVKAGGPGSGCQGPNCGRPAGHSKTTTITDRSGRKSKWVTTPAMEKHNKNFGRTKGPEDAFKSLGYKVTSKESTPGASKVWMENPQSSREDVATHIKQIAGRGWYATDIFSQ